MITYRNLGQIGRLGNALFELASTIGIAETLPDRCVFPENWIHRPYFSVPDEYFNDVEVASARESTEFATHLQLRARPYLQDIHLFWDRLDKIREYLQPSPLAREILSQYALPPRPRIGVHVRRGDNVFDPGIANKEDYHLCPSLAYYQKGIAMQPPGNLVVISDDTSWCSENIPAAFYGSGIAHPKEHEPEFLTTEPRDWIDLFLLAQCDYFVISGSTFGIWGVILANVPPENVIRPDKVYGPLIPWVYEDLLFHPYWRVLESQ